MQLPRHALFIVILALLGLGLFLAVMLAGSQISRPPAGGHLVRMTGERFCRSPPGGADILSTSWGMATNRTGISDGSSVLLQFSLTGYPGKMPRIMYFSFIPEEGWQEGVLWMVVSSSADREDCGSYAVYGSQDRWNVSGEDVLRPSQVLHELEQINFSDLGLGGRELSINTALGWIPPDCSAEPCYLLTNGTFLPLREVRFDPGSSLKYPWSVQVMECSDGPDGKGCSSGDGLWVFPQSRLKGAEYAVGDRNGTASDAYPVSSS